MMENRACWICFENEESESALIRPCQCFGNMKWVHESCINSWASQGQDATHRSCRFCGVWYRLHLPELSLAHRLLEKAERRLDCWLLKLLLIPLLWHLFFSVFEKEISPFSASNTRIILTTVYTFQALLVSDMVIVLGAALLILAGVALHKLGIIHEPAFQMLVDFALQFFIDFLHIFLPSFLMRRIDLPPAIGSLMATRRILFIACLIACNRMDFHDGETPRWVAGTILFSASLSYYHCYRVYRRNTSEATVLPFV